MKIVGPGVFVCQSVCLSKHFGEQRPNGWSDRDAGGTGRRPKTPERRWCRSRVDRRHMARGTCGRVKSCKKLLTPLQVKRGAPPIPNSQVSRTLSQPVCVLCAFVCFCGYGSSGVQAARDSTAKLYSRGILRL